MPDESTAAAIERQINNDVVIAEYNALRNEVNTNSMVVAQVFTISVTGVAAIIGFAVQMRDWRLCLVPSLLLLPSLIFIASQIESTVRIAAYTLVILEPRLKGDLSWESALHHTRRSADRSRTNYMNSLLGIYMFIVVISLALGAIYLPSYVLPDLSMPQQIITAPLVQYGAATLFIVLLSIFTIATTHHAFSNRNFTRHARIWEQVSKEIGNQVSSPY